MGNLPKEQTNTERMPGRGLPARWVLTVVCCMLIAALVGTVVTRFMKTLYEARATVFVQGDQPGFQLPANIAPSLLRSGANPVTYALVILQSRDFAASVVAGSQLMQNPEFTDGKTLTTKQAVARVRSMVSSEDDGHGLIIVTARTPHADLAALLANTYVDRFSSRMVTANQTRRQYTGQRIKEVEAELRAAEERLKSLSERAEIADLNQQTQSRIQRAAALEAQLQSINVRLEGLDSELRTTGDIAKLAELKGEKEAVLAQQTAVGSDLASLKQELRGIPELALDSARLERDVNIKARLFQTLSEQHQIALINEKGEQGIYQIVDRAEPPVNPYRPDFRTNLIVSLLLGLLIGIAINLATSEQK